MKTYLYIYLGALVLATLTTPVVIRLARWLKAFDRPGLRKVHTRPVPRLGGVAIFFSALGFVALVLRFDARIGEAFRQVQPQLIALLAAATCVFLIGLIDDLRGLPAMVKLLAEIGAAGLLCYMGIRIAALQITPTYQLPLGGWSYPLTVVWIVGVTNALNLSDGLDGLAAGIAVVACVAVAVFAFYSQNLVMGVLMLVLLGDLTGFLFYNFNPAKVFMGDCGSLFLGFTIASSSVLCSMNSDTLVGLALPSLALGIPILDTLFTMLRRFLERRSLFAPDRSHFHHRLIALGLKHRDAVLTVYAATCITTALGLFMMVRRDAGALVVYACLLLLLVLLFQAVGEVRLRETLTGLWHKGALARRAKREKRAFEELQLRFRRARNPRDWWQAMCASGVGLDLAWISLTARDDQGTVDTRIWRGQNPAPPDRHLVTITLPVETREAGLAVEVEVAIASAESLESAARRGALFSRLMDEYRFTGEVTVARGARPSIPPLSAERAGLRGVRTAAHFKPVL